MNRRTFIRGAFTTTVAAAAGSSIYAYGKDTHDIETTTIPLVLGLNKPLRVVTLGDIHFDPLCEEAYIERVTNLVTGLRADIILYTGDFVTAHADRIGDLADLLSRSVSRLGSFAVPGNHEHWTGFEGIVSTLEKRDIRVLCNQSLALPDEDSVYLTGLDSFWSGKPDLTIFSRALAHSRHILLVHEPDSFTQLDDPRIRLQISGHTHGGQIRVPLYGALVLPKMGQDYDAGLFTRDGRKLYVNRGIGTLTPHVRFNCRPEITVFDLT
jgi:predicted MPP superfamily phosphohydrolase